MKRLLLIGFLTFILGNVIIPTEGITSIVIDYTDSGWYRSNGEHDPSNLNYAAGSYGYIYRNWFVFDLSGVTTSISSGVLRLYTNYAIGSGNYTLRDVSTDITTLQTGGTNLIDIYNDLGTGSDYGSINISSADDYSLIEIELSASALTDINSALGNLFAIGGEFVNPNLTNYLAFSDTNNTDYVRQLVLEPTVVPIPGAMLLLGTGIVGILGIRSKLKK